MIVFEHPLTERVRGFLRLEFLFKSIATRITGPSEWDSRAALARLSEVVEILSRYDIKVELIKELERHYAILVRLQTNREVEPARLNEIISQLNSLLTTLKDPLCQPGQTLRQDELVNAIRQRIGIPGGTCNFYMPAYHSWLNRPAEERINQLHLWFEDLRIIEESVTLALKVTRGSADPVQAVAPGGYYHQSLEPGCACSLIRIGLPKDWGLFPEISAGKPRFTLRFMEQQNTNKRPIQTHRDVRFELSCCTLSA